MVSGEVALWMELRDDIAVALADRYLVQPRDMTWEDRTDQLADEVMIVLERFLRERRTMRLHEVPTA